MWQYYLQPYTYIHTDTAVDLTEGSKFSGVYVYVTKVSTTSSLLNWQAAMNYNGKGQYHSQSR